MYIPLSEASSDKTRTQLINVDPTDKKDRRVRRLHEIMITMSSLQTIVHSSYEAIS